MARLLKLGLRLNGGLPVSVSYIRESFGVGKATAQRDLAQLEQLLPVRTDRTEYEPGRPKEKTLTIRRTMQ